MNPENSEQTIGVDLLALHAYEGMPHGLDLPWNTSILNATRECSYITCRHELRDMVRYDCFLVDNERRALIAVNQAFVVPLSALGSESDREIKDRIMANLDLSVLMTASNIFSRDIRAFGDTMRVWIGLTPFRGESVELDLAYACLRDVFSAIAGREGGGVMTVPESGLDTEACDDNLIRTPNEESFKEFWQALGFTITNQGGIAQIESN